MKKEDIEHLATLSRIRLEKDEIEALAKDITDILGYVAVIDEIAASGKGEKKVRELHSVLREDSDPHEPGVYSEDLLKEAPERDRNYIKVKKILNNE